METKSPSPAGRSTAVSMPKRSRMTEICSSISASVTSTSSTVTARSSRAGRSSCGATSTSAVKARVSLSSRRVTSMSGWPSTRTWFSRTTSE
jgi:hypothetical protein